MRCFRLRIETYTEREDARPMSSQTYPEYNGRTLHDLFWNRLWAGDVQEEVIARLNTLLRDGFQTADTPFTTWGDVRPPLPEDWRLVAGHTTEGMPTVCIVCVDGSRLPGANFVVFAREHYTDKKGRRIGIIHAGHPMTQAEMYDAGYDAGYGAGYDDGYKAGVESVTKGGETNQTLSLKDAIEEAIALAAEEFRNNNEAKHPDVFKVVKGAWRGKAELTFSLFRTKIQQAARTRAELNPLGKSGPPRKN
jgi:hypothetical protein